MGWAAGADYQHHWRRTCGLAALSSPCFLKYCAREHLRILVSTSCLSASSGRAVAWLAHSTIEDPTSRSSHRDPHGAIGTLSLLIEVELHMSFDLFR